MAEEVSTFLSFSIFVHIYLKGNVLVFLSQIIVIIRAQITSSLRVRIQFYDGSMSMIVENRAQRENEQFWKELLNDGANKKLSTCLRSYDEGELSHRSEILKRFRDYMTCRWRLKGLRNSFACCHSFLVFSLVHYSLCLKYATIRSGFL